MRFDKNPWFWLVTGFLAVWRITNIVQREEIASPVRQAVGIVEPDGEDPDYWIYPDNFIGKVFHCFWCGSIWVAGAVTILLFMFPPLIIPFALSAPAIAFKGWMEKPPATFVNNYWMDEDEEELDDQGEDDV